MSGRGELVLLSRLTDFESLDTLAIANFPIEAVPTKDMRPVVEWALDYYYTSARRKAPSPQALSITWGEKFQDCEIELIEPDESDTMDWAIEDLKCDWARSEVQKFNIEFATAARPSESHALEVPEVIHTFTAKLLDLDLKMTERHSVVPVGAGLDERIAAYEQRAMSQELVDGLFFGFPVIDEHIGGVHPGESAVVGAPAKLGKSFFLANTCLREWQRGRRPVLFTLENSKEMTLDRIACLAAHLDGQRFERGTLSDNELNTLKEMRAELGNDIFVVEPGKDERTVSAIHRQAQLLEADSLVVDQLTWVHHPKPDSRRPRTLEVQEIMHQFKEAINGRVRMPLLLAHQINREGIKRADKAGFLQMVDFADSSDVERTVDHAFGLYQSRENSVVGYMLFQTMAARRHIPKHWLLNWDLSQGVISFLKETSIHPLPE